MRRLAIRRPSPAMLVALIALAVALGGTAYAATQLPANSVGTKQIRNKAVTNAKLANKAVTNAKLADKAVSSAKIVNKAVTNAKLADNAVGSKQIKNSSIEQQDLAFLLPLPSSPADIFSGFKNGPVTITSDTTVAKLQVPSAAGYAVVAKAWAQNNDLGNVAQIRCTLSAGVDTDTVQVWLGKKYDSASLEALNFTLVHALTPPAPLTINLSCHTEFGVSTTFRDIKITAITAVGTLHNTPIS